MGLYLLVGVYLETIAALLMYRASRLGALREDSGRLNLIAIAPAIVTAAAGLLVSGIGLAAERPW